MAQPEFVFHWRGGSNGYHRILRLDSDRSGDYVWFASLTAASAVAGRRIVRDLNYANEQRAKAARARKRRAAR